MWKLLSIVNRHFQLTRQKDEDKETDLLTCGVDVLGIIKQKVIDPVSETSY